MFLSLKTHKQQTNNPHGGMCTLLTENKVMKQTPGPQFRQTVKLDSISTYHPQFPL